MSFLKYENWKKTPLAGEPYLSVIVATKDAEQQILVVIDRIAAYVSSLDHPWELILCDTGSQDKTPNLVEALNYANLTVLRGEPGKDAQVIQKGMLSGRGRYVLFEDIHDSIPIEELSRLLPKLTRERYDLASGRRIKLQQSQGMPLQAFTNRFLHWLLRSLVRLDAQDPGCSFRLYTRPVVQRVFPVLSLDRRSIHVQALYLAHRCGYRIAEVPVGWTKMTTHDSQTDQQLLAVLPDLIKARLEELNGKYKTI